MKRYPSDKFPPTVLRPNVVAKHEELIKRLQEDVEKYTKVGHRDPSMFDWVIRVFENLGLSTVQAEYLESLAVIKTKFAIFAIQLDDLVDNEKMRNFPLFDEIIKIPFEQQHISRAGFKAEELAYLDFTQYLWGELLTEIKKYPNYEKYKDAFNFDVLQLLNSMSYSKFVNLCGDAANIVENEAYVHHGMFIMIQMDLDLMCSSGFKDSEFSSLRELAYISQKMGKIGNLIGTYPRELLESDMSSEAVIKFLEEHGADFRFKLNKILNRESRYPKFEEKLIEEWQKEYQLTKEIAKRIKSVDMDRFMKEREFIQEAYLKKADFW